MADTPQQPPQHPRRPALKYNHELAAQYGIVPDQPTIRETIKVDLSTLPDPPGVSLADPIRANAAVAATVTEDTIVHVITEEMDELTTRLSVYGVAFGTAARQQMVDTAMALLAGVRPGGTMSGR